MTNNKINLCEFYFSLSLKQKKFYVWPIDLLMNYKNVFLYFMLFIKSCVFDYGHHIIYCNIYNMLNYILLDF